jgi:hypothetical protein
VLWTPRDKCRTDDGNGQQQTCSNYRPHLPSSIKSQLEPLPRTYRYRISQRHSPKRQFICKQKADHEKRHGADSNQAQKATSPIPQAFAHFPHASYYITNSKEAIDEVLGRTLAFDLKRSNAILKTDLLPKQ